MHVLTPVPTSECPLCRCIKAWASTPVDDLMAMLRASFGPCAICGATVTAHGAFCPHDREDRCAGFVRTMEQEII